MSKYYHYSQNNSGGDFVFDEDLTLNVVIEAESTEHADERAERLGIYFDGVPKGRDCECCGDRWDRTFEHDGRDFPHVYGESVADGVANRQLIDWTRGQHPHTIVHHLCGRVDRYTTPNPEP
jgi:hypothetical protein